MVKRIIKTRINKLNHKKVKLIKIIMQRQKITRKALILRKRQIKNQLKWKINKKRSKNNLKIRKIKVQLRMSRNRIKFKIKYWKMLQKAQSKKNSKIMDQRKILNHKKIKRLETNKL